MQVDEGLRARKKRETRERIAKTAMRLFLERGYDAVPVSEIARAADVSEKTVFNYFPTKEDLAFARFDRRLAALEQAIRDRPAGASLVEPFRSLTLLLLDGVEHEPVERTLSVPRLVTESKALRDRLFVSWEEEAERLTPLIAEEAGAEPGDLIPAMVTRTLTWAHRTIFHAAFQRLLAGEDQKVVARDLRREAKRVYHQLEMGLALYGRRAQ